MVFVNTLYINNVYYTVILFLFAKLCWCSPSTPHSKNIDIDDFITKLLRSEKFNDLADLIAEKAARKLQHLNNKATQTTNKKSYLTNEADVEEHLEDTAEETLSRSKEKTVFKKDYSIQEAKYRNEYAKLRPQTFTQVDSALPTEQLLLKYNYLTKGGLNKDKQKTEINMEAIYNDKDNAPTNVEKPIIEKNYINQNKTNKFSNMATSSEYINLNTEEEEEIRDKEKLKAIFQSEEKIDSGQNQKHMHEESDNEKEHDEIKTHYSQLIDKGKPETISQNKIRHKESSIENFLTKTSSGVNKNILIYSGKKQNSTPNFEKLKENVESVEKNSRNKEYKQNKEKHVRKEGGKVFTFETSPDYEEYHEQTQELAKTQDTQLTIE